MMPALSACWTRPRPQVFPVARLFTLEEEWGECRETGTEGGRGMMGGRKEEELGEEE